MGEVKSIVEQVARELCRWQYGIIGELWIAEKRRFRREARKIVKMVCGSCGLAGPLRGKVDGKGGWG